MSTIFNAKNRPLNAQAGTLPDVSGTLTDWFQPMVFVLVQKQMVGFQSVERGERVSFRGMIQPLSGRKLELKPEGQRAWTWFLLHADPSLKLDTDQVVIYQGVQTRVMMSKDYSLNGYIEYELAQDFQGGGL